MTNPRTIVMIKSNPLSYDSRMLKEIDSLLSVGYRLITINWGERDCSAQYDSDCFKNISLHLPQNGSFRILLLPVWWIYVFINLIFLDYDVIHIFNIHSILPGVIVSQMKNKPCIYELEDVYEDGNYFSLKMRNAIKKVDKYLMEFVSAVIIVDDMQNQEFEGIPNNNIVTIYDSPPDTIERYTEVPKRKDQIIIFNEGYYFKKRDLLLESLFQAVVNTPQATLILSGIGDQVDEIKEWAFKYPNKIVFLGYLPYEEIIKNSLFADILLGIRNPEIEANKYNCGSKLMKSLMVGKPCLVSVGTSGANIVKNNNCGIVVDARHENELRDAINLLINNIQLREELGKNARLAYENRYGWHIMENRLFLLYQSLFENRVE